MRLIISVSIWICLLISLYTTPILAKVTPSFFVDARKTSIANQGKQKGFEGDVIAMGDGMLLVGDHLIIDQEANTLLAEGHVFLISGKQLFGGDTFYYDFEKETFRFVNGFMVSHDEPSMKAVQAKVLGFTQAEFQAEINRQKRLEELNLRKKEIITEYQTAAKQGSNLAPYIEQYAVLFEREELIKKQENTFMRGLGSDRRDAYKSRRKYWQENKDKGNFQVNGLFQNSFFRVKGAEIQKVEGETYLVNNARFTPCFCATDETPDWGIHAGYLKATTDAYADLYNPVLEIKGVPVLYLPFVRLSIKNTRQSGLLIPFLTSSLNNGIVYSQPYFWDIAENKDATITMDYLSHRGPRLGFETRVEQSASSGFNINVEGLHDRAQSDIINKRVSLMKKLSQGLDRAFDFHQNKTSPAREELAANPFVDPSWWENNGFSDCLDPTLRAYCFEKQVIEPVSLDPNPLRGKIEWKGSGFVSERLSLGTQGLLLSDHRYLQDLYIGSVTNFFTALDPQFLAKSKVYAHYDERNYYLGLRSKWGDKVTDSQAYSGYQVPFEAKAQSRLFLLNGARAWLPIYGQVSADQTEIRLAHQKEALPYTYSEQRLGKGSWQQVMGKLISPISSENAILVDFFSEAEQRSINYQKEVFVDGFRTVDKKNKAQEPQKSTIQTLRTGLNFSLPMDGQFRIPSWFKSFDQNKDSQEYYLEHEMSWGMGLSLRPWVKRTGAYGEENERYDFDQESGTWSGSGRKLLYYITDTPALLKSDPFPNDAQLVPHERVTFSTSHDWYIRSNAWAALPREATPPQFLKHQKQHQPQDDGTIDRMKLQEQARTELFYNLDQATPTSEELLNPNTQEWYIHRYQLDPVFRDRPLHIDASISYDRQISKRREELLQQGVQNTSENLLPEAWSTLDDNIVLQWKGWGTSLGSSYNFYNNIVMKYSLGFFAPTFFATKVMATYNLTNAVNLDQKGAYQVSPTLVKNHYLSTGIIPHVYIDTSFNIQTIYKPTESNKYESSLATTYLAPSDCWGLKLGWKKEYSETKWAGSYFVSLVVKFIDRQNDFPVFSSNKTS